MGFFSSNKNKIRYGALIDVGSGSVLTAIVASDPQKTHPDIIWSKREYTPLRKIQAVSDSAKSVMTSLMNALMSLDGEGRKALSEKYGSQKIDTMQVTVAAPWSYTATKTITYQNEEEFEVSETLVAELLRTAQNKVEEEMLENEKVHELGLSIVARTTIQVIANGYPIQVTGAQNAKSVKVIEATAVVQEYLINAITDAQSKMFAGSKLTQYSFMLPYYLTMNSIMQSATEFCLVDITYESTEIGIVRDGILTYCTHTPYGSFSIAREIAETLSVPLEEAYGYLTCDDMTCFVTQSSEAQQEEINKILKAYQVRISELFKETGDTLAIPKKIFIHGNLETEPFFNQHILKATTMATKMPHAAYNVSAELLAKQYTPEDASAFKAAADDTALLISAQFFHTQDQHSKFEQL
jgi:Tfp pilus assembly PilM family ATPase